jgi:hypothetical protein
MDRRKSAYALGAETPSPELGGHDDLIERAAIR